MQQASENHATDYGDIGPHGRLASTVLDGTRASCHGSAGRKSKPESFARVPSSVKAMAKLV